MNILVRDFEVCADMGRHYQIHEGSMDATLTIDMYLEEREQLWHHVAMLDALFQSWGGFVIGKVQNGVWDRSAEIQMTHTRLAQHLREGKNTMDHTSVSYILGESYTLKEIISTTGYFCDGSLSQTRYDDGNITRRDINGLPMRQSSIQKFGKVYGLLNYIAKGNKEWESSEIPP